MIDLHIHSRYSDDGEYTPKELVEQCFAKGIQMMSVTDHNCVRANIDAQSVAKDMGIIYIAGIEIDCIYKDTNFHVLGYGIDYQSKDFEQLEQNIEKQSLQASLERLDETRALGFHVTKNDMLNISKDNYRHDIWTGEMFAEVILAKPEYLDHPLLHPYRLGGSRSDNPYVNFYWDYYSQGKPCYVKIEYPSMEEVIDTIHRNQGVAVLAHPGINLEGKENLLNDILDLGLDGIEAFSSYHTLVQANYYKKIAGERQKIITYGSDYHGKIKPAIKIGDHGCIIIDENIIKQLNTRLQG